MPAALCCDFCLTFRAQEKNVNDLFVMQLCHFLRTWGSERTCFLNSIIRHLRFRGPILASTPHKLQQDSTNLPWSEACHSSSHKAPGERQCHCSQNHIHCLVDYAVMPQSPPSWECRRVCQNSLLGKYTQYTVYTKHIQTSPSKADTSAACRPVLESSCFYSGYIGS